MAGNFTFDNLMAATFLAHGGSTHQSLPTPGLMVTRLQGLGDWSSETKRTTMVSIADDIAQTMMKIGKHVATNDLEPEHTDQFSDLIGVMCDTKGKYMKRKIRRLREQKHFERHTYRACIMEAGDVISQYERKVRGLKEVVKNLKAERMLLLGLLQSRGNDEGIMENGGKEETVQDQKQEQNQNHIDPTKNEDYDEERDGVWGEDMEFEE
ncbi:hypothetical protein N7520_004153 [Penicillium odoratum]|uniref:uncharacterized protein n=1 Tax=Penicillium odoratum TaxID=1167516 RepID=UPI0025467871|nr:uncharacterized protein N7520_004153 [Penicillium odoratum]KAJ5769594.1 hypothetical protein N7520_004153 [Penicillium odoratum]